MSSEIDFDEINVEMIKNIDEFNTNYLKEIYEEIKDKLNDKITINFLNDIIYINFNLNHIIDFVGITIIFDNLINEYVLVISLYNIKNNKFKSLFKKITNVKDNSNTIISALVKIFDYITFDYLFIHFA